MFWSSRVKKLIIAAVFAFSAFPALADDAGDNDAAYQAPASAEGAVATTAAAAETQEPAKELKTMGWIEKILLMSEKTELTAKLDTGAKTSSVRSNIEGLFTKDGQEWVKYNLPDAADSKQVFEKKIIRWAEIREMDGGRQLRPVVEMIFCLGSEAIIGEVTLAPRPDFNQPALVGRNMLNKRFLVDVSRSNTVNPSCQ